MKDSTRNAIIVIAVIYILLSLALGSFNPTQWNLQRGGTGTTPTYGVAGMFDVATKGYNTLDISTALAENTNYHCYWFAYRSGWLMLGKGDTTIELIESDGGFVYAVVEIPSGQDYYVDWSETKSKNPRVTEVTYEDPDADGYKEFVFKINMANIPKPATGNPKIYFYPYLLAYEKPSLSAASDITGIGGSKVTKYVEWYTYFANVKKAFAITKIELSINTTDTTKVTLDSMAVPGLGSVTGDMFGAPVKGVSSLTWSYSVGSNLYNAHFIEYGTNTLNKFYFTTQIDCLLASGDVLQLDITIYGLTPTGTLTTLTDSVVLKSGT